MIFTKNQLIKINTEEETIERILWIDSDYEHCFTINIYDKTALPELKDIKTLTQLLEEEFLVILTDEPFNNYFSESELSESETKIREYRWNTIKDLVNKEPDIYFYDKRGKLIKDLLKTENPPTKKSIYSNLRLFWQRGNDKNALLPDYKNSGGRGKTRNLGVIKVGRKRKYGLQEGINITKEIRQIFSIGIKRYLTKGRTLIDVFDLILKDNFVKDEWYENGRKRFEYVENYPTIRQFRYWYENNSGINSEKRNIYKKGKRKHLLEDRPLLGTSDLNVNAPGAKYQIDATIADVYLVSEMNRNWIVGRPTLYFVVDVFSRAIVGLYVGLEEPSWLGATMALVNTTTDKKSYCKEFDIDIEPGEWPSNFLPDSILADQGEFKGYKAEQLITEFGVRVENAPSYRADLKGIVEQNFNVINGRFKPFTPGSVTKEGLVRGGRDYRLDARYTLKEFTQIIIISVLEHNNSHWLNNYKPDRQMIADDLPLIPNKIWEWGIKNRSGKLKYFSEDVVKLRLLPRRNGRITRFGIKFKNDIYYTCKKAETEGWFQDSAIKGTWTVNLAYDPRNIDQVYLLNKDGSFEICTLLKPYQTYKGLQFEELEIVKVMEKINKAKYEKEILEGKASSNHFKQEVYKNAEKKYKDNVEKLTKTSKLKDIRENKNIEKEINRKKEAFILGDKRDSKQVVNENEEKSLFSGEVSEELKYLLEIVDEDFED